MSDLIDRQAAIEAIKREQSLIERPITETRWFDLGLRKAQDILSELSSVQPEPKRGRWVGDEVTLTSRCSVCKAEFDWFDNDMERFIFCPNCGAKMEVNTEE